MDHPKINQGKHPVITKDLIDYLKGVFPDRLPLCAQKSTDVLNVSIGQVSVWQHLEQLMASQEQEARNSQVEVR